MLCWERVWESDQFCRQKSCSG